MATSTSALRAPQGAGVVPRVSLAGSTLRTTRRYPRYRRIDPQSGHALEILGHAIEYLTDEYVHAGGSLRANNAQVEAIQLLIMANRAIYFGCPPVPSLGERLRGWFHFPRRAA
jgi:hypothetical protein